MLFEIINLKAYFNHKIFLLIGKKNGYFRLSLLMVLHCCKSIFQRLIVSLFIRYECTIENPFANAIEIIDAVFLVMHSSKIPKWKHIVLLHNCIGWSTFGIESNAVVSWAQSNNDVDCQIFVGISFMLNSSSFLLCEIGSMGCCSYCCSYAARIQMSEMECSVDSNNANAFHVKAEKTDKANKNRRCKSK